MPTERTPARGTVGGGAKVHYVVDYDPQARTGRALCGAAEGPVEGAPDGRPASGTSCADCRELGRHWRRLDGRRLSFDEGGRLYACRMLELAFNAYDRGQVMAKVRTEEDGDLWVEAEELRVEHAPAGKE